MNFHSNLYGPIRCNNDISHGMDSVPLEGIFPFFREFSCFSGKSYKP